MPENEKENNEQAAQESYRELEQILKALMDAPGYVLFVGRLEKNRDDQGRNLISYNYKRYQFSYEDVRRAIEEFGKHFRKDLQSL